MLCITIDEMIAATRRAKVGDVLLVGTLSNSPRRFEVIGPWPNLLLTSPRRLRFSLARGAREGRQRLLLVDRRGTASVVRTLVLEPRRLDITAADEEDVRSWARLCEAQLEGGAVAC